MEKRLFFLIALITLGLQSVCQTSDSSGVTNAYSRKFGLALGVVETYPADEQIHWAHLDLNEDGAYDKPDLWRNAYTARGIVKSVALAQRVSYSPLPNYEFSLGRWELKDRAGAYKVSMSRFWGSASYRMPIRSLPFLRPAFGITIAHDRKSQADSPGDGYTGHFLCTTRSTSVSALIGLRCAAKRWVYGVDVEFVALADISGSYEDHIDSGTFRHRLGLIEAARNNYMIRPVSLWIAYTFGTPR